MSLTPGTRLGPYEIVSQLGGGGMGEVFRARDSRLDRMVALKTLRPEFAADPERRARFEREAHAIGALTHPHICPLYDVGSARITIAGREETVEFLLMELLEGNVTRIVSLSSGANVTGYRTICPAFAAIQSQSARTPEYNTSVVSGGRLRQGVKKGGLTCSWTMSSHGRARCSADRAPVLKVARPL